MRLKIKHCIIPMLMASVLILTSCDSENYLTRIKFNVEYYGDWNLDPIIDLFCNEEKMIDYFSTSPHDIGNFFIVI